MEPFGTCLDVQESKQEITKVVSLVKMAEKLASVSNLFKAKVQKKVLVHSSETITLGQLNPVTL